MVASFSFRLTFPAWIRMLGIKRHTAVVLAQEHAGVDLVEGMPATTQGA
jgi:hypothetical protein